MIVGRVTDRPEMIVRVVVRGPEGGKRVISATIDTGFDGSLTLPSRTIAALKLPLRYQTSVELGDGSEVKTDVHGGAVEWDGRQKRIYIDAAETDPLLGMTLLKGFRLDAEIRSGGRVRIERLPRELPRSRTGR